MRRKRGRSQLCPCVKTCVILQDDAGRHQFDSSAMGCTYHEYKRKDVLKCLARPNGQAALAMIGGCQLLPSVRAVS